MKFYVVMGISPWGRAIVHETIYRDEKTAKACVATEKEKYFKLMEETKNPMDYFSFFTYEVTVEGTENEV